MEPHPALPAPQQAAPLIPPPKPPGYPTLPHRDYAVSQQAPEEQPQQGGLLEYWHILRRRIGTVILAAFLGLLIGFLKTLPETPVYQAYASIEIMELNNNFLNIKQANPVSDDSTNTETSDIQTHIKILQSESLIERVLEKLKDPDKLAVETSRISAWRKALNLSAPKPEDARTAALSHAAGSLKVRAAGQTRIIEITVDSTEPRAAAAFANTLANEFIDQNLESRWQASQKTSEWLTRQLDAMRVKLERSEDELQRYARAAGLVFTQEKNNVDEEKLRQLQSALTTAQGDRIEKQSRYEMAVASPPEALPDILNDPDLRDYQNKETELRRQIAELTATYTAEYPKVKRIEAQLSTIDGALIRARNNILKRINNDYDEALHKEKLLEAGYTTQAHLVSGEGEKAIHYNILNRAVDSDRQIYDAMLLQLQQSTVASALRASNVRIVDPARIPGSPYKPDAPRSAAVGLLAGLFMGIAFVVMHERADRTIQQPGDATFYLNLPELGIIPSAGDEFRRHLRLKYVGQQATVTVVSPEASRVELVTWQRKGSMAAESFRSALISILFSGENGSRPRVIVLTSPNPGEGKSTVVSNLGIAIAEVGNRVLLIDSDLRKPRLHSVFEISTSPGLGDLLKNHTAGDGEAIGAAIRATSIPNLSVLTAGDATQGAMSLLYGSQMPELLQRLRPQFDTILIDTPPMLQIPDARILGRMSDRVILVVRGGKTTRDAAQAAVQRFREDGTKILGTILNGWDPKRSPDGYYGYNNSYYYRYGYGKHYGSAPEQN